MASATAWAANPFWTGSYEGGKWLVNKVGGPVKNWFNSAVDIPNGVVGGVMGANSYQPNAYRINEMASERDRSLAGRARTLQQDLGARLTNAMNGQGPSVAELQMRAGTADAMQGAQRMAAGARGVDRGMALRNAMYAGQRAGNAAVRDAGMLRAGEQLAARGQFANVADSIRQGDIVTRGQDIDIERANQQAWGQQEGLRSQISEGNATRKQKGYGSLLNAGGGVLKGLSDIRAKEGIQPVSFGERLSQSLQVPEYSRENDRWAPMVASMDASNGARIAAEQGLQAPKPMSEQDAGETPTGGGLLGGIGGGLESFGSGLMSDRASKERIKQLEDELETRPVRQIDQQNPFASSLAPVKPYQFEYKPTVASRMAQEMAARVPPSQAPAAAEATYQDARKPRVGVMAQDLEKGPGGKAVVESTPVGKVLDLNRAVGFSLAGVADLDKRIRALEGAGRAVG